MELVSPVKIRSGTHPRRNRVEKNAITSSRIWRQCTGACHRASTVPSVPSSSFGPHRRIQPPLLRGPLFSSPRRSSGISPPVIVVVLVVVHVDRTRVQNVNCSSLSLCPLPSRFACFLFPSVFRAPIRLSGSSPPSLPRRVTGGAGRARTLFQSMIVGRGWVGRGVSRRAERKWWRTVRSSDKKVS